MNKLFFAFLIIFVFSNTVNSQELVHPEPVSEILLEYPKVRDFTVSSSGKEAYLTIQSPIEEVSQIACLKKKNNEWSRAETVSFSGKYKDLEPYLSPDNTRLYFVSNRPLDNTGQDPKDFDIWYVERKNISSKWSEPKNLGERINSSFDEFYPAIASNKNLYFTRNSSESKGEDDIFFSSWTTDGYNPPISLDNAINTKGYEFNSYISPDESFLIFTGYNREDGLGSGDLYISHRNNDGHWSQAKNLGPSINSKYMDYCPFVDLNSKTLYFTSTRSIIKKNGLHSIKDLKNEINQYSNGLSRIYVVLLPKKLFE